MTISKLNKKLDKLLKDYLKEKDYVNTGSLLKSIKFKCTFNQETFDFDVELEANEYILYLNDGELLQDFLSEQKTTEAIAEFIAAQVVI
jgi:hypothetical protein